MSWVGLFQQFLERQVAYYSVGVVKVKGLYKWVVRTTTNNIEVNAYSSLGLRVLTLTLRGGPLTLRVLLCEQDFKFNIKSIVAECMLSLCVELQNSVRNKVLVNMFACGKRSYKIQESATILVLHLDPII